MPWSEFNAEEVFQEITPDERTAIEAAHERLNAESILARVVAKIRGACIAAGAELGPDGTIPDGLKGDAVAMARWRFLIAIPSLKHLQTEDRKDANDSAEDTIKSVSRGEYKVESPGSSGVSSAGGIVVVSDVDRQTTRAKLDGL